MGKISLAFFRTPARALGFLSALAAALLMLRSFYFEDDLRIVQPNAIYHADSLHGFLEFQITSLQCARTAFNARELPIGSPVRMLDSWSNETFFGSHLQHDTAGLDCELAGFRLALQDPGIGSAAIIQFPHWALIAAAVLLSARKTQRLPALGPLPPACPRCGYDTRASAARCPECGTALPIPPAPA
ncbi:MAG: hypothetical protein ACTHN5_00880 [Phycisphaerae bacterium]